MKMCRMRDSFLGLGKIPVHGINARDCSFIGEILDFLENFPIELVCYHKLRQFQECAIRYDVFRPEVNRKPIEEENFGENVIVIPKEPEV